MTGSSLFGLLGRNKGHYSQSSTPSAERNPERLPGSPGDELPLNRTSTIHRENQQAISSAGSVSNGSGSSIPAGCCAFLITGLRQGVSFISLIKDQEYPEAVTSRKTMLMWLHACASIGYSLGRMTGGPPRSCFLFRSKPTLKYSYPSDRPDPAGIAFVSSEFHNLFVEAAKKVSRDGPLPSLPAESASAIQPLSPQVTGLLPQVVVMMPIYAKSRLSLERLNQALDVLSTQALMPTAVLLIDDCGPVNLVEYFQVSISPRFTLKQRRSGKEGIALSGVWRGSLQVLVLRLEANHGPAFARNVGLKAASAALPSPAATNPPSANNSARGSLAPANPRSPQLPYQMVVACFLDLGCIPSSNQWTFHHASAQASIGGVNHGGAFNEERRNSTVSKASSRSSRAGAGRELWAGKLGGIVVGRAMASKALHPVGVYHDLFGTLNCRKLDDGSLLYGTSCNMSFPLHLFLADPEPLAPASTVDVEATGPSRAPSQPVRQSGLIRFNETFPAPAFEDVQLCLDARALGVPMVEDASAEASVVHDYNYSSYGLFTQFLRYGQHEWRVLERHDAYLVELGSSCITSNY